MQTQNPTPGAFPSASFEEEEVVIRLSSTAGLALIASSWPTWTARLFKRYGRPYGTMLSQAGGKVLCTFWQIPIGLVTFRKPSRPRPRRLAGHAKTRKSAGRVA